MGALNFKKDGKNKPKDSKSSKDKKHVSNSTCNNVIKLELITIEEIKAGRPVSAYDYVL